MGVAVRTYSRRGKSGKTEVIRSHSRGRRTKTKTGFKAKAKGKDWNKIAKNVKTGALTTGAVLGAIGTGVGVYSKIKRARK